MDLKGRYLGCNLSFSQFIGRNFSEIDGKTCDEILDTEDARILTSGNQELLKNPGMLTYSGNITIPGKKSHTITIQKSPFSTKEGIIAGFVGLILSNKEK